MKTQCRTSAQPVDAHEVSSIPGSPIPRPPLSARKTDGPEPAIIPDTELVPAVFLDSAARVGMVDPSEIWQMPRFTPVLVFVPKAQEGAAARGWEVVANFATVKRVEEAELTEKRMESDRVAPRHDGAFGAITVNFMEMAACRHDEPVELTTMEFKTLKYLMQNARRVISRDELLNEVWGYEHSPCTRTVDNHILRLRRKLEPEPARPVHFRTVRGVGYKFLP